MRQLETAHTAHIVQNGGQMLSTSHSVSWMETLRSIDSKLLMRSPVDDSPHFPGGTPINGQFRETSYSVNRYVSPDFVDGAKTINEVPRPGVTVHFALTVFNQQTGNPGDTRPLSDHLHADAWAPLPPFTTALSNASAETQVNAHSRERTDDFSLSAYGYLDGHAETQPFRDVYTDASQNRFDYRVAR